VILHQVPGQPRDNRNTKEYQRYLLIILSFPLPCPRQCYTAICVNCRDSLTSYFNSAFSVHTIEILESLFEHGGELRPILLSAVSHPAFTLTFHSTFQPPLYCAFLLPNLGISVPSPQLWNERLARYWYAGEIFLLSLCCDVTRSLS